MPQSRCGSDDVISSEFITAVAVAVTSTNYSLFVL